MGTVQVSKSAKEGVRGLFESADIFGGSALSDIRVSHAGPKTGKQG